MVSDHFHDLLTEHELGARARLSTGKREFDGTKFDQLKTDVYKDRYLSLFLNSPY